MDFCRSGQQERLQAPCPAVFMGSFQGLVLLRQASLAVDGKSVGIDFLDFCVTHLFELGFIVAETSGFAVFEQLLLHFIDRHAQFLLLAGIWWRSSDCRAKLGWDCLSLSLSDERLQCNLWTVACVTVFGNALEKPSARSCRGLE
jgi:hypothetical protein